MFFGGAFGRNALLTRLGFGTGGLQPYVSFWHGTLDPISYTCLASFAAAGQDISVYSYMDLDLPKGVKAARAADIVRDRSVMERFIVKGKPSLSKFSNHFRYEILAKTNACWVDCDVLCLTPPDIRSAPVVNPTPVFTRSTTRC